MALRPSGDIPSSALLTPDLVNHPIYRHYNFGKDDRVIDIGVQPLWIPTNIISETIRRDKILKKTISDLELEIRFHAFLKGADVNFFLFRGDLEVGIGGDMPTLIAVSKGKVLISAIIQQGFCSIVARNHMMINQLRGKRIGYAFGSNAHYSLLNTLAQAGLSEDEVNLVAMDVNDMPPAIMEKRIDAFSAWEPTPFIAENKFEGQTIIHRSLSSGYMYFSRALKETKPEAIRLITASALRAVRWVRKKDENLLLASRWALDSGSNLSSRASELTAEEYARLAKNDLLGTASVPVIPETDLASNGPLHREFNFLKRIGAIDVAITWESVKSHFDRSIIANILSDPLLHKLRIFEYENLE